MNNYASCQGLSPRFYEQQTIINGGTRVTKESAFHFLEQEGQRALHPFISHLTVKMDGTPLLVCDSSCSAGEDAAFLLLSAKQAGRRYAASISTPHPAAQPSHSIINMKRLLICVCGRQDG